MSRPHSIFSAFRGAFARGLGAGPRLGAGPARPNTFTFGSRRHASQHSATVHTASLRNTIFRPITLVLIFAPILTGYLGIWQVQRLKWKVALIDEVNRNLEKPPMKLPAEIK